MYCGRVRGGFFLIRVGNCVVLAGSGWGGAAGLGFLGCVYGSLLIWFRRFCCSELCVRRLGGCSQMLPCRCKNALLYSGECLFFWYCKISMVSCMLPNICWCVARCCACLDVWVSCWKALLCSLNLVLKLRPVCPTYAFLQSGHVKRLTPDCVYMSGLCGLSVRL